MTSSQSPPSQRQRTAVLRRAVPAAVRSRDVAVLYGAAVVATSSVLLLLPDAAADAVVLRSSTNLVNLRLHPPFVLVASAFVEPGPFELLLVVPLVWALGELQRRLGRAVVLVTAVLGHVGATLVVSTVLLAGITHGRVALSDVATADVGVSYVLVTSLGVLTAWAPRRRAAVAAGGTVALVAALVAGRTFTDLGHLAGWLVGLGLALVVDRARREAAAPTAVGPVPAG